MYNNKGITDDKRRAQLIALSRDDKDIEDISTSASHVALYELRTEGVNHVWHKTDIEGSLYLLRRRSAPRFKILVKNQSDSVSGDFDDALDHKVALEVKEHTVFYRVGDSGVVRGIWFASKDSLHEFTRVVEKNNHEMDHVEKSGKMLMQLLKKDDRNKLEPQPSVSPIIKPQVPPPPPALPARIASAPTGLQTRPNPKSGLSSPIGSDVEDSNDAVDLLRQSLEQSAWATNHHQSPQIPMQVIHSAPTMHHHPHHPPIVQTPQMHPHHLGHGFQNEGVDMITIRRSDLRVVLADMIGSDGFINELFTRLAIKSSR